MGYHVGDEPVPGYRLESVLGEGGFGKVWKARGPGGIYVAIKIISLGRKEGRKEFRSLRLIKLIHHPNLVELHGFWLKDDDGQIINDEAPLDAFLTESIGVVNRTMMLDPAPSHPTELVIAMRLGDMTLADRLQHCKNEGLQGIPVDELLNYMECSAKAIDFLNSPRHDLGDGKKDALQHCDIKPQNIVIVGDDAQVCDFGLVRALSNVRMTSAAVSLAYGAPELMSRQPPSASTDQYSLAVSYVELRTGRLPCEDETPSALLAAHLAGNLDLSGLQPAEQAVIKRATALAPTDRYPNTAQMVRALREAQQTDDLLSPTRATTPIASTDTVRAQPVVAVRPGRKRAGLMALAAVCVALGGVFYLVVTSAEDRDPAEGNQKVAVKVPVEKPPAVPAEPSPAVGDPATTPSPSGATPAPAVVMPADDPLATARKNLVAALASWQLEPAKALELLAANGPLLDKAESDENHEKVRQLRGEALLLTARIEVDQSPAEASAALTALQQLEPAPPLSPNQQALVEWLRAVLAADDVSPVDRAELCGAAHRALRSAGESDPWSLVDRERELLATTEDGLRNRLLSTTGQWTILMGTTVRDEYRVLAGEMRSAVQSALHVAFITPLAHGAKLAANMPAEIVPPVEHHPGDVITNSIGMKLTLLPAGRFMMGTEETVRDLEKVFELHDGFANEDERPPHPVEMTRPFWLGTYEVTLAEFRKFADATGYRTDAEKDADGGQGYQSETNTFVQKPEFNWRGWGVDQQDNSPVANISWNDAVAFCGWLSRKEKASYRLPTEAEWEYACRAGTQNRFSCGNDPEELPRVANVADGTARMRFPSWVGIGAKDGFVFSAPVGSFQPNAFGLYDMHGNVWEWCGDWYDEDYYRNSPIENPPGPSAGELQIMRGGGWLNRPVVCRCAYRRSAKPSQRSALFGFRVMRQLAPQDGLADETAKKKEGS